jgi:hypothetical protein
MVMCPAGLGPKIECAVETQNQTQITDPQLSPKRAPHIEEMTYVKIFSKEEKEKLVPGPRWRPDTRRDWLIDCWS